MPGGNRKWWAGPPSAANRSYNPDGQYMPTLVLNTYSDFPAWRHAWLESLKPTAHQCYSIAIRSDTSDLTLSGLCSVRFDKSKWNRRTFSTSNFMQMSYAIQFWLDEIRPVVATYRITMESHWRAPTLLMNPACVFEWMALSLRVNV